MGRKRSQAGANKALDKLLEKGIGVFTLGVVFFVLPSFLGQTSLPGAIAAGFRSSAAIALLIGAASIGLHFLLKRRAQPSGPTGGQPPESTSWAPPGTFGGPPPAPRTAAEAASPAARSASPASEARRRQPMWNGQVFDDIEWRRFEAVCETLFAQGGFKTRSQSHGADGGVDIWLHSKHAEGPAAVVQCKHWNGKQVGVKELREFFGVMASHGLKRGTYATTSTFTADAAQFAKANGVSALDRERLLALIATRTPEQQLDLLEIAYHGEYWRPTCASCGVKMVERESRKKGSRFWGCLHFPKCKSTLPMRAPA